MPILKYCEPIKALIILLALTSFFIGFGVWVFSFTPSAHDHDQAFAVASAINYSFREYDPDSNSHPPSMYVKPGVNQTTLIIYGISNAQEQEKVLQQIKIAKIKVPEKTISVRFMDKENWVQVTDAMRSRGHEKLLRTELIH